MTTRRITSRQAAEPIVYRLTIPGFLPVSVNELLSTHPMRRSRLKRADADQIAVAALLAGVPAAECKRRVSFVFRGPRDFDGDNRLKSILDALVKCRLLRNDSPGWCVLGGVTVERGERGTVIELADIG